MMKRFMIYKHPHVITATSIQRKGATTILEPTLRFRSLSELVDHFAAQGVPSYALKAAQESIEFTGKATLTFFESSRQHKRKRMRASG
jgi:hypothetical protein